MYQARMDKKLDLNNPTTFNEKLQWLKLYDRNPLYPTLVDKYEVREYVKNKIGNQYLVPLLGVWDNFQDIDFSKFPNQFVLKTTHDSGGVVICSDKNKIDKIEVKKKINNSLRRNYYYGKREWPYKNVNPLIISEEYLNDEKSDELKDYKFFCFNGEVKVILVVEGIGSTKNPKRNFYDEEWNLLPFNEEGASNITKKVDKPKNYSEMIEIAEKLSQDISFVRVDLYEVNDKIYFGELTFTPQAGFNKFDPDEYDSILGSWLNLPQKKHNENM